MQKYTVLMNHLSDNDVNLINVAFKICVYILDDFSSILGISYEALNLWIFVVIQPFLIVIFFTLWILEKRK